MNRKEAIVDLIAKVEAEDIDGAVFWRVWPDIEEHGLMSHFAVQAHHGSLDAAKALHEAVLPMGEGWEVYRTGKYPGMIPGSSPFKYAVRVGYGKTANGDADNPARAWLLAILSKLLAEAVQ